MSNDTRKWAKDWDGKDVVYLQSLAVRAYVEGVRGGDFMADDSPNYEDGAVELKWTGTKKRLTKEAQEAFKRGDGKIQFSSGCVARMENEIVRCYLTRRFEDLAWLKSLSDSDIANIARADRHSMEIAATYIAGTRS